jgi:hypothetical protein
MRHQSTVNRIGRSVFLVVSALGALALDSLTAEAQVAAQKYALMVGVTNYDHAAMNGSEALKFPEADAQAVGKMLGDHGYEVEYLLGPQATRVAILQKLRSLNGKGNSSGICVVGFFGHGVEVEFKDAQGKKDIQGCFCPFETTVRQAIDADGNELYDENQQPKVEPNPESLVKMSEVVNSLALAKAGSRMLIADCCRDMPNRARGRNLGLGANFNTDRLPGQTVMLFGCRPGERALERDDWKHGAFTKALLEELTSMAAGPDPVTSGTLADRVKRRVQRLTSNQQNPTPISLDSIDLLLDQSSGELSITETSAQPNANSQAGNQTAKSSVSGNTIPESSEQSTKSLDVREIAKTIPSDFQSYLIDHPVWLTADSAADIVYVPEKKRWLIIAVASSKQNVKNPKLACKLKALAALAEKKGSMKLEMVAELNDSGASQRIEAKLQASTSGLPLLGEWKSVDGEYISLLYGFIVEIQ